MLFSIHCLQYANSLRYAPKLVYLTSRLRPRLRSQTERCQESQAIQFHCTPTSSLSQPIRSFHFYHFPRVILMRSGHLKERCTVDAHEHFLQLSILFKAVSAEALRALWSNPAKLQGQDKSCKDEYGKIPHMWRNLTSPKWNFVFLPAASSRTCSFQNQAALRFVTHCEISSTQSGIQRGRSSKLQSILQHSSAALSLSRLACVEI